MAFMSSIIWGAITAFLPLYAVKQGVNPGFFFAAMAITLTDSARERIRGYLDADPGARRDLARAPVDRTPERLADLFCRVSRRKVEGLFQALRSNDDAAAYRVARDVLDHRFTWLELGIIPAPNAASHPVEAPTRGAAAGR